MKKLLTFFTALTLLGSMTVVQAVTYTPAGTPASVFTNEWTPNTPANDMVLSNGLYVFAKRSDFAQTSIQFKVCKDHAWTTAYPGSNYSFTIPAGAKHLIITYNTSGNAVNAFAISSMTVAGDNATLFESTWAPTATANDMVLQSDGTYKFEKSGVALSAGAVKFKACANHAWTNAWPSDNYELSIPESGNYTITITFNPATLAVTATAVLEEAVVVIPTIQLHSNITNPSWESSANFALAGNEETASLTLTGVTKGNYEFGVKIDGTWTSNGSGFTRANPSHAIAAGSGNCTFNADVAGDYTFTWTYADNSLSVTYPELPAQFVEFNGLASQILKGTEVTFAATSTGITNPVYTYFVKPAGGEYGSALASYTFNTEGNFVVKVSAEGDNTIAPVVAEESVSVYGAHTFTNGTTIYVDFSAMTEGTKGVNYPKVGEVGLDYDDAGAGTLKTVAFNANVTWTTNDVFIKTEKAGWAELKFTVPGDGQNCAVVAADGASYTWTTLVPPPPTIKLHGDFTGSWANTDAFVLAGNNETASLALTIPAKGMKSFGVRIGSDDNWTSNGAAITRASASASITSGEGNCSLNADIPGEYIFTWTYASNTLSVTYPELPAQFVEFDGLASQILKGSEVTFAATSTGITNPVYSYFVKPEGGEYGSAVAAYTFNAEGNFVVKVSAEGDNTAAPVVAEENVSVYDAHTFTSGTTIFVDFSAMTEGTKGVNYPKTYEPYLDYDAAGAGTIKTVTFSADVQWTTNDVFIKTEKAGWAELKFSVPGAGENCAVVAADGASYTWTSYTPAPSTVVAKGDWDSWVDELAFTLDEGGLSASATKNLTAGNYAFKVIIGGEYRSNNNTYHRGYNGAANITGNEDNMILQADADGDYIFTWTFATNAIQITFPAAPIVVETAEVKFFPPRTEAHQWEHVYAYQWKLDGMDAIPVSEAWPGDEITSSKEGVWYKCTVDKGTHIIFSDGEGMQTYDIDNVQEDVCYVSNRIDEPADPADPIKVAFEAQCTVDYYITGDEGIAGAGNAWNAQVPALKLDGSNQITLSALPAGIYEFKITNGTWAWSIGGKEHLKGGACSNVAVTSGSGNVKFKTESAQDVTITYFPATQEICVDAETVLPYEEVRTGLTPDNYYTICNSREMKQIRGASLWSFASKDASFAYLVREDAPFAAGKPFIVWAESDKIEAILDGTTEVAGSNNGLYGTFTYMNAEALSAAGADYMLYENELRRIGTNNHLDAYRAYVKLAEIPDGDVPAGLPKHRVRAMPMQTNVATDIDALNAAEKPVKMMIDGQLFILRGENLYDATGRLVK